jgi:hypothetical protein
VVLDLSDLGAEEARTESAEGDDVSTREEDVLPDCVARHSRCGDQFDPRVVEVLIPLISEGDRDAPGRPAAGGRVGSAQHRGQ